MPAAWADWPTFRGADRSGVSQDTGLLKKWPESGPKLAWETRGAGRGYASPAIRDGRIYTLGDSSSVAGGNDEYLSCFDAASGKLVWQTKTGAPWNEGKEDWQGSRSTPSIDESAVYVITPHGHLVCCNLQGKLQYDIDLKKEFGGQKADSWGYSESPLIDGNRLICTPGGQKNTMVALNKKDGSLIWSCPQPDNIGAGHASVVMSDVGGRKVYVTTTGSGAIGVDAKEGKLLWSYPIEKTTAVIPTPIVRDDLVFFSVGYKRGGALLRQKASGGSVDVEEVYGLTTDLANKHGGVILIGDYLYGDSDDAGVMFCAEFMTGKQLWKSRGPGSRSIALSAAEGQLYALYQSGVMALVNANPKEFQLQSSFEVPHSGDRPSWAHPVIDNRKLFIRQGDYILCYDIAE